MRHANENYTSGFVRAFEQPTLRCVGTLDGAPCPHAFAVDLAAPDAKAQLAHLHLDHEQPVHLTCAAWAKALPAEPRAWDEGVDRAELCRALFDVGGGAWELYVRCSAREYECTLWRELKAADRNRTVPRQLWRTPKEAQLAGLEQRYVEIGRAYWAAAPPELHDRIAVARVSCTPT